MALREGAPIWMARIEERRIPALGCIAWVPKGPSGEFPGDIGFPLSALSTWLRALGARLVIADPWKHASDGSAKAGASLRPKTIWIDLSVGRSRLWQNLDKQWRYGVGRAERLGVIVERSRSLRDIEQFFALCADVSQSKG